MSGISCVERVCSVVAGNTAAKASLIPLSEVEVSPRIRSPPMPRVEMLIEKRGGRATPSLTIPAARARQIARPEHLEVRSGTIEMLTEILRGGRA